MEEIKKGDRTGLDKAKIINGLLYIIFIAIYLTTLAIYHMGNPISRIRYFFFAVMIIARSNNNCCKNI